MHNKELISIIIPFRDRTYMVEKAVESVLKQSYQTWEVILVDDFSTETVSQKLTTDNRIKLIHNTQNLGPSASRQRGLLYAQGQYICFLDSDDMYHPHFLEKLFETHSLNTGIAFAYCSSVWIDLKCQKMGAYKNSSKSFKSIMPHLLLENRPWHTSSLMWNRSYLAKWHKSLRTWEDYLIEFQSAQINNKIEHVNDILCFIYKDEEQGLSMAANSLTSILHRSKALQIMLMQCPKNEIKIKENIIIRLKKEASKLAVTDRKSITLRRIFLLTRLYSPFRIILGRNQHWYLFNHLLSIILINKIYLRLKWLI